MALNLRITQQRMLEKMLREEGEDYRGDHRAPDKESGAPLHDLTGVYPEDIYGPNGVRYYGDYGPDDHEAIRVMRAFRGRPQKYLTVYRAIPKVLTDREQLVQVRNHKAYILRHGKLPPHANFGGTRSEYYEWLDKEEKRLEGLPLVPQKRPRINPGDWVTTVRRYAVEHGKSNLDGQYRILSKMVHARDLYTDGNSIYEWGYDPTDASEGNKKGASNGEVQEKAGRTRGRSVV